MKRFAKLFPLFLGIAMLLIGCTNTNSKTADLSLLYGITAGISILLGLYFPLSKKWDGWYILLFASVAVVNIGYFLLSISHSEASALMAHRLSYFGSVFLPFSMYMIIRRAARMPRCKWLEGILWGISLLMFFIAASPGILDIYYKDVAFTLVNGVGILEKVYGPLHFLYMVYLLGYFAAMVGTILYTILRNRLETTAYAVMLTVAVFVNIGVWLIEKLIRIDFEILSVSYIISECFLLGLHFLMSEHQKAQSAPVAEPAPELPQPESRPVNEEALAQFREGLSALTPKEQTIYQCYLDGMPTAQIMESLNIKENTLKFHNKNLYSKLGVSSRKQLLQISKYL